MKKSQIRKGLLALESRYYDLVWLARNGAECCKDGHPSMPAMIRLAKKYPAELKELKSDNGNWAHGFNTGCLAAFRFVLVMLEMETQGAGLPDGWPGDFLDS